MICLFLSIGCATPQYDPGIYRSENYIIYKTTAPETSANLAKRFLGNSELDWMIDEVNATEQFRSGQYAVIPLKWNNIGGIYNHGVQQVPILCYHHFARYCDSSLCVPADIFESQMKYLKENGFHVILPDQLLAFLEYRQPLPRKSVIITIDDGYASFYDIAYPILEKYGFSAALFIYVNYVGVSRKALTWNQLRELKAAGYAIGSHTIMHSDLSKQGATESDQAYAQRLRHEIFESKRIIDTKLNQNTTLFAYPFGRANESAIQVTREAGYKIAVTVDRGGNSFFSNVYALRREQILKTDMRSFKSRLKTFQPLSLR